MGLAFKIYIFVDNHYCRIQYAGGPVSAAQSCVMLGLFSFVVDRLAGGNAAATTVLAKPVRTDFLCPAHTSHSGIVKSTVPRLMLCNCDILAAVLSCFVPLLAGHCEDK